MRTCCSTSMACTENDVLAPCPLAGDPATLLRRLEAAVDRMLELRGDGLGLELLLAEALTPQARE